MMDILTIALYVLQALGLYTIAKRRGIRNPWLAWIPFGSVWILGAICDDYKTRCGKSSKLRVVLLVLTIVMAVLAVIALVMMFATLFTVMTGDEVMDILYYSANVGGDLYAPTEQELIDQLAQTMEARLTDEAMNKMLGLTLGSVGVSLLLCGVAIAAMVVECICMYKVFESCDPANKLVFFLVGLFVGIWAVFLFVVRNKDLGMPQGLPGGFDPVPPQEPWNV